MSDFWMLENLELGSLWIYNASCLLLDSSR